MTEVKVQTLGSRKQGKSDIPLTTGRVITHTKQPNGSWFAKPTTGPEEMTPAEWDEYCEIVRK